MSTTFVANVLLTGRLLCRSGLHIGAGPAAPGIGGLTDHPVVRDAVTDLPYVPGSSIRGRLRSLLTLTAGEDRGLLGRVFGTQAGAAGGKGSWAPARLQVRDAHPTEAGRRLLDKLTRERGLPAVEIKAETALNRITGEVSPRRVERVPAGAEFELGLLYSIYDVDVDGDRAADLAGLGEVLRGLRMLEETGLGGGTGRGNGQVSVLLSPAPVIRDAKSYLEPAGHAQIAEPVPVGRLDPAAWLDTVAAALTIPTRR